MLCVDDAWLPATAAVFCLVAVRLAAETLPEDFDAVTLLRDVLLPPMVPRPVLLLEPMPLLAVVLLEPANTRSSIWVSWRGPYEILLEKWPPCPCPGPWPCPQCGYHPPYHPA